MTVPPLKKLAAQQGLRVLLLGAVLLGGVGCRSVATSPELQLQAREGFHQERNAELMPAVEFIGVMLSIFGPCL